MTSGIVFGLAVVMLAAVIVAGLMRRSREAGADNVRRHEGRKKRFEDEPWV